MLTEEPNHSAYEEHEPQNHHERIITEPHTISGRVGGRYSHDSYDGQHVEDNAIDLANEACLFIVVTMMARMAMMTMMAGSR